DGRRGVRGACAGLGGVGHLHGAAHAVARLLEREHQGVSLGLALREVAQPLRPGRSVSARADELAAADDEAWLRRTDPAVLLEQLDRVFAVAGPRVQGL